MSSTMPMDSISKDHLQFLTTNELYLCSPAERMELIRSSFASIMIQYP